MMTKTESHIINDPFYQDDLLAGMGYLAEDDDVIEYQTDGKYYLVADVTTGQIISSGAVH